MTVAMADDPPRTALLEAFVAAGQRYYERLRPAERPDALKMLELREGWRAERARGSQLRKLRRREAITTAQMEAGETWAGWHAASQAGVASTLGQDAGGGGDGAGGAEWDATAWRRFDDARAAILKEAGHLAEAVTRRIAVDNRSPSGAVAELIGRRALTAEEAVELLRAGLDALVAHFARMERRR